MTYNSDKAKEPLTEEKMRSLRRRKRRRLQTFIMLLLCLVLLVILMYGALLFVSHWKEGAKEDVPVSAGVKEILYSEEEMDAKIEELTALAQKQAAEAADARSEEILGGIQSSLENGTTMVETLRPYYPDDLVLVSNGAFHFVPISDTLKHHDYKAENLRILETGELQYEENGEVVSHKGIDVSKFQGDINWKEVAEDGVEFAFIRVILRGYGSGKLVEDEYFEQNIKGATAAGIKVGVYVFSQAVNEEELMEEANKVLEMIAPYKVECPVVFDVEKIAGADGRMNALTVEERTDLTLLFCQTIENAGYRPMIYHNMEMGALLLDLETLEDYDKWFAYYNQDFYYPYAYKVWQYSEKGRVAGIDTEVDLNISFVPLWEE